MNNFNYKINEDKMKLVKLILEIMMVILFLSTGFYSNSSFAQSKQSDSKKYIQLQVNGLACPFCAYGLEKKLKALDGAGNFDIDFKTGIATLDIPNSNNVTKEELKQIVSDAGFELKNVEISGKPFNTVEED